MVRRRISGIEGAMRNSGLVITIVITLIIVGAYALYRMPRNEFPVFTIRQGVIVGVFPGASSEDVEKQLTSVVENYIFGYQEIKKAKTYSYSREGMMYIFVELNDDVKNADQFWSKLRHGLSELKMTLPSGVAALIANSDFGDTSALLITLSSDSRSYKELEEQLKKLEGDCRKIPATSKIKHYGLQKEKIFVNVKPELLNEYNIKSISLLGTYQSAGMISYAGRLDDGEAVMPVHFPSNFESERDLAEQIVYSDPDGNVVRLKNIATIERRYDEPDSYIRQNGSKTILLSLEMQPGNNIVEFGKDVDKVLNEFKSQCPSDISVEKISDLPRYVSDSVNNFMKEFLIAIVAVILVTMVLLPFRVASVAGITVPVSVMITMVILYLFGVELHTVSLASLILVLGMIVDNSIVVIDNHVDKIDHGLSPWHAAISGARELIAPIIVATLAIIAAYVPLGFMVPGTAGEFMRDIPIVVSSALIVSVLVALLLVPFLNYIFIKKGLARPAGNGSVSFLNRLQSFYNRTLEKAFSHPKTVVGAGVVSVLLAVLIFSRTDQQLFPELERNQFAVEVYLPTGASINKTRFVVDSIEAVLMKDNRVTNVTSFIGTSSPRFQTVYAPQMPASNYGQLLVNTISDEATRGVVSQYEPLYTDCFAEAHVKWKILAMQAGKSPIEIRISSDSIRDIRSAEAMINHVLAETRGLGWVRTDWDTPQQDITVNLDRDKATRLGYYKGLVATSLMIGLDGIPLTTIWEGDYPVDVILTEENGSVKDADIIKDKYITSPLSFSSLPLRSVATLTPGWTEGTIVHRNGIPTLTVLIDNAPDAVASAILADLQAEIEALDLPDGTTISYGGDYEAQQEVFIPMGIALAVSIVLIFFILLVQFKKQKIALLIMSAMLMTLPGAAIGLKIMHYPFSITAFIGITSLCGMVVRNGIILIDHARELRIKEKMSVRDAAIAAGKRRMRPIFLTSAAAAVGVVPMIMSRSPLWGPLGTVICFGLLVSMILALYILPLLYSMVYTDKVRKPGLWSVPSKARLFLLLAVFSLTSLTGRLDAQTISLDSCRSLALKNNQRIKDAEIQVQQSAQQKKEALSSFLPKVSASAMALRSDDYLIKAETPGMNLPVWDGQDVSMLQNPSLFAYVPPISLGLLDYINNASVSVTLPLYAGGRIRNGNRLASLGSELSSCQMELTTDEVLFRTEQLFWNLQSLTGKEETLIQYQIMLDSLCRDVNSFLLSGLAQKNDLLKVQLKQNELEANLYRLRNGIELTKRALCQHIGIDFDSAVVFIDNQLTDDEAIVTSDPEAFVRDRSDYRMMTIATEAQKLQKKMTIGEYLPQLAVTGTGFAYDAMNKSGSNALVLISLNIPISDWWGGSHKIKRQQYEVDRAIASFENNTELLELQIFQVEKEVKEMQFQIMVSQKSVAQAEENMRVSDDNYNAGTIGISDLLEAQALYQESLNELLDARCKYNIKRTQYRLVTGQLH